MLSSEMTMAEALRQVAAVRPDQEALVCGEVRLTYGQLLERVTGLAYGLHQLEVHKGDKIALLLPPGIEFVTAFFAAATLGAVVVPLNPQLREHTLGSILQDAEPVVLVAATPVAEEVLRQSLALRHVITDLNAIGRNDLSLNDTNFSRSVSRRGLFDGRKADVGQPFQAVGGLESLPHVLSERNVSGIGLRAVYRTLSF